MRDKNQLPKIAFATALNEARRSKGITWHKVATKAKVPEATLRAWVHRNRFRRDAISAICQVVFGKKMSPEDVESDYQVTWAASALSKSRGGLRTGEHELLGAMRLIDRRRRAAEQQLQQLAELTPELFKAMDKSTLFAFDSCTVTPKEFRDPPGEKISGYVAEALMRGARCVYIRPSRRGLLYFEKKWKFDRLISFEEASVEFDEFREYVKRHMVASSSWMQEPFTLQKADAFLHQRLAQIYVDRSPMWLPGVALGMFAARVDDDIKRRMTIRLPGDKLGGILLYPDDELFQMRFARYVRRVFREERDRLRKEEADGLDHDGEPLKGPRVQQWIWRRELMDRGYAMMHGRFTSRDD